VDKNISIMHNAVINGHKKTAFLVLDKAKEL